MPSSTWVRNVGLYGIRTRVTGVCNVEIKITLQKSSTAKRRIQSSRAQYPLLRGLRARRRATTVRPGAHAPAVWMALAVRVTPFWRPVPRVLSYRFSHFDSGIGNACGQVSPRRTLLATGESAGCAAEFPKCSRGQSRGRRPFKSRRRAVRRRSLRGSTLPSRRGLRFASTLSLREQPATYAERAEPSDDQAWVGPQVAVLLLDVRLRGHRPATRPHPHLPMDSARLRAGTRPE